MTAYVFICSWLALWDVSILNDVCLLAFWMLYRRTFASGWLTLVQLPSYEGF